MAGYRKIDHRYICHEKGRRTKTSFTFDTLLLDLFSVKLGKVPGPEGDAAIKEWLHWLFLHCDRSADNARKSMIRAIADEKILHDYKKICS